MLEYFLFPSATTVSWCPVAAMISVKDLPGVLGGMEAAIEGADAIKVTMRTRTGEIAGSGL